MTLDQIDKGCEAEIKDLNGGHESTRKLLSMGLYPGERVRVVRNSSLGGPILVEVCGNQVAIGRGIASKVVVEDDRDKCRVP
jgi:ferrous iron transport protein A